MIEVIRVYVDCTAEVSTVELTKSAKTTLIHSASLCLSTYVYSLIINYV